MHISLFRFYADLNDFLALDKRGARFPYSFFGTPSVKDAIEANGVPHPEVSLILINGNSVGFQHLLHDGVDVAIYPHFRSLNVGRVSCVAPAAPEEIRFILDVHLGKLAAYLRLLGFDAEYNNSEADACLAERSVLEGRLLLTRDRGLLKRSIVQQGYCVRQSDPTAQVVEILQRFDLWDQLEPFSRCMACNGAIQPVLLENIEGKLLPGTSSTYRQFFQCDTCGKVYWSGSHVERMNAWVQRVLQARPSHTS